MGSPRGPRAMAGPFWRRFFAWLDWKQRPPADAGTSERRRATRFEITPRIQLVAIVEGCIGTVPVRNVSIGGVSLIMDRTYPPDTILNVQLLKKPHLTATKLQVRVCYTLENPD